jgi:hypothetical protein
MSGNRATPTFTEIGNMTFTRGAAGLGVVGVSET